MLLAFQQAYASWNFCNENRMFVLQCSESCSSSPHHTCACLCVYVSVLLSMICSLGLYEMETAVLGLSTADVFTQRKTSRAFSWTVFMFYRGVEQTTRADKITVYTVHGRRCWELKHQQQVAVPRPPSRRAWINRADTGMSILPGGSPPSSSSFLLLLLLLLTTKPPEIQSCLFRGHGREARQGEGLHLLHLCLFILELMGFQDSWSDWMKLGEQAGLPSHISLFLKSETVWPHSCQKVFFFFL